MPGMQNAQLAAALSLPSTERYSVRQRLLSASVSLAMSGSAATTAAMANAPAPVFAPAPQATPVHSFANAGHTAATHAGFNAVGAASVSNLTHASVFSSLGLTASSSLHPVSSFNQATHGAIGSHPVFKTNSATHSTALTSATGQTDLNLSSVSPIFQAGGLAGFHNITIVVGGKEQLVTVDSKLTAAELVAAQQVLNGSKQEIKINGSGVATGGYFDLSSSTVSALDGAIGGQLGSLVISHGVKAVDSLSTFDLTGSLINMGKIVMTTPGAGQSVDTINADNIYNRAGGVISSTASSGIGIGLDADNTFSNSGTVSSGGTLNISAPTVINAAESNPAGIVHAQPVLSAAQNVNFATQSLTNSGLISSQSADINVVNGGGNNNIVVNGDGGTIQATKGNINFNATNYDGSGSITLNGGDYLSKQVNLDSGTGNINANVSTITGQVNGVAANSHVTAATEDLNLGTIAVSGDPTYYNTKGNVTITGTLTGDPDLAIVASGNIIANGGALDTSAATASKTTPGTINGGNILLVAGAAFTTTPTEIGSGTTLPADADTTTTLNMTGSGSKTGGYIDLSGSFYTGNASNKGITAFTSSGLGAGTSGNITIIAYEGSSKFSGGVFATPNGVPSYLPPTTPAVTVNAQGGSKDGNITVIGGGSYYIFSNGFEGANVSVSAGTPISPAYTITDGKASAAMNYTTLPGSTTNTIIFVETLIAHGNINITTPGAIELGVVNAAGIGGNGVGSAGAGNGTAGGSGGNITITGGSISAAIIDSSGAGGGGGSSAAGITGNGGAGGNGGAVDLTSTSGNISVSYYLNASGGGGGGGAGANENSATVGAGGAGGHAGIVTINAKGSYVAGQVFGYSILDFDGAAGGAGGLSSATYGGGGGGGGTGFGGGGGGGAAGMGGGVGGGGAGTFVVGTGAGGAGTVAATAYAAYGGGGGSAAATSGNVFGTAGSLNTANAYSATNLTGVVIGGAASVIHENTTGTGLLYLNNGGNGGGYLSTSTAFGGAGGGANGSGQGGLDGLSVTPPLSYGSSGGFTTTSTGAGAVYLTVGNVTGKANAPILVDGPKYYLTGTTKNASMYLSCGGDTLTLESASFVSGSTLNLSETHDQLIVAGPVTGASNVVLDGWQGVQVNNSITADKSITIIAGQTPFTSSSGTEQFGGNITTSGAGSIISAPTVSLTAYEELTSGGVSNLGGNITAHVAGVTSLAVNGQGNKSAVIPNTSLQIDTAAGKTTTITSGNAAGGFAITADGFGMVTSSKAITATNVIINADATIGSATKPLLTNASGSITVNGSSPNSVFVKDANVNTLTISGSGEAGESVTITSAAKTLKVGNFDFTNVNITDTYATAGQAATVTLGNLASDKIGDGTGTVIISSAAANIVGGTAGYVVQGTSVSISSKTGDIGTSTAAIATDSANLSLSAAKGSVYAISQSDVDLGAIVALNSISVISDGALNIGGAIGTASTASVYLESVGNMTDTSGSYVSGKAVSLFSNGDMGTADDVILTKASATFTLGSGASSNIYVTQNGKASLTASTLGPNSVLNFIDLAPLVVTGEIDGGTINITAPSLTLQAPIGNVSGKIFGTDITITSPVIAVKGADGITATDALTLTSATSLTITGVADSITSDGSLALGSVVNGKTTSAITLGDAKTGANNPLGSALNGGTDNLNILTTGNFTSSATSLVTAPVGGAGGSTGTIDFTAKAIVVEGTAPTTAFTFTANGNAIGSGGDVFVDFTGTQNVTLGSGAGQFQISNAGAAGTGNVAISAGGILTVNAGGLNGAPADLSLSGGKGLGVNSDILSANLSDVVLYSGAKTPFAVNAGGMSQANGTIGAIDSTNVAIGSAGPIVLTSGAINASNVSLSNNAGALTISGPVGSLGSNTTTLNLNAASGITLGDAKTGAGNPLDATFLSGLSNFSVNAGKGNFTSNITNFALNQASTDTLIIHAANIIATGSSAPTQFTFSVGSGSFSDLDLNLTGTQTVTISASAGTAKAPTYEVVNGAPNGQENINVGGILIVADKGGLTYNDNSELSLSGGKGLQIVDPTQFAQANTQLILNLSSGSASPLVVGAVSGTNYVAGNIDAGQLSITAKGGLTISSGASVTLTQGSTILFNTSKLTNNGTIAVSAAGGTLDLEGAAITVTNGTSASYDNIANLNVLCGSVNFGNLFSTPTLLNTLNSLSVFAEGVVTVSSPINANSVDISASTIAYKGTGTALSIDASSVTLTSGAPLVIGTGKGAIDLSSTLSSLNLQSSGTVTLNESLTVDSGLPYNIIGSSIAVNSTFNGQNGGIGFFTAGVKGAVTTGAGATINGAELVLGGGSTTLSKTALSIDASQVQLTGGGAWNIANAVGGSLTANTDIAALTYTSNGTVNVGGITTTAGNINLTTIGGNLIILNGSSLDAVKAGINLTVQPATGNNTPLTLFVAGNGQIDAGNGNIVLLNTSSIAGSSITFGGGLSIHASGTAAGVGQVVIAMGSVPSTSSLTAGVVPSGVQVVGSGGGGVYLGNQNNLDGTVDNQGSLILNADGRNVVINDNGNHSAIVFQGSNTITADPPVVFGAASQSGDSHAVLVPAVSLLAAPSLDSTVSTSSPVNAGGGATLYAPAQANQSALNVVGTASSARDDGRALQGEISNHALRQLQDGSLFIAPDVDTVVQTSGGSVNVAAGSVALLVAFKGGVAVYNMHDTKRGSVVVEQFGHKVALTPGRSVVLTNRSVSFFEEVNPAEFVGYRRVQAKAFEDGVKSFQAEFDVRTMLSGVAPLKAMLTSKEAHDKHVSREMLKTTAILMSATDATPYQLMAAPRLTAMGN